MKSGTSPLPSSLPSTRRKVNDANILARLCHGKKATPLDKDFRERQGPQANYSISKASKLIREGQVIRFSNSLRYILTMCLS